MAAHSAVTREYDRAEKMYRDLTDGLDPDRHRDGMGFLYCSMESDFERLNTLLRERLPFPCVGGTSVAYPFAQAEEDVAASLTVVSRPGTRFSISLSGPLAESDAAAEIDRCRRESRERLGETPRMILTLMPLMPDVVCDKYYPALFEVAGEIPVFGGMISSDDLEKSSTRVFAEGKCYSDRMAFVSFGGDIRPVFSVGCDLTIVSEYAPTVTASTDSVVSRVDDKSLCDYLRQLNFEPEDPYFLRDFPLPALLRRPDASPGDKAEATVLLKVDPATGTGVFAAPVPEGSRIRFGNLTKDDILRSTAGCLEEIARGVAQGRAEGREYDILLGVSCLGRYFHLVGAGNVEGAMIASGVPSGLALYGYYGFNEVCPVFAETGSMTNRTHGYSLVMCAL